MHVHLWPWLLRLQTVSSNDRGRVFFCYSFALPENPSVLSDEVVVIETTQNRSENVLFLIKVLDSKGIYVKLKERERFIKN